MEWEEDGDHVGDTGKHMFRSAFEMFGLWVESKMVICKVIYE